MRKQLIIAVSKSGMLDNELKATISKDIPAMLPPVFISSITGEGLSQVKDMMWKVLNEQNLRAIFEGYTDYPSSEPIALTSPNPYNP